MNARERALALVVNTPHSRARDLRNRLLGGAGINDALMLDVVLVKLASNYPLAYRAAIAQLEALSSGAKEDAP